MPILDPLPIKPFIHPVQGEVTLPGSKSITNRALLLAALCKKPLTLTGALFSEDTIIMTKALSDLGFDVTSDEAAGTMKVAGHEKAFKKDKPIDLFVGNAGTAARFLTALCAAAPAGTYIIDGVQQMHRRPMKGLIDALRTLGATITCLGVEGFFPLRIDATGLRGGKVTIDASESSQMLSALLMVMPLADGPSEIYKASSVREPFVNMTLLMMGRHFGFDVSEDSNTGAILTRPVSLLSNFSPIVPFAKSGGCYPIEADATSASYFMALTIVNGGKLSITNMPDPFDSDSVILQGDGKKFIDVMRTLGAEVTPNNKSDNRWLYNWLRKLKNRFFDQKANSRGGITISYTPNKFSKGLTQEFREFSDTFLTFAAMTPLLRSTATTISGIKHTRMQETDRIQAMEDELKKIIGDEYVTATEDSLRITPIPPRTLKHRITNRKDPIEIETYNDHRMAMSFAILGTYDLKGNGKPWISIKNPGCCAKTFPNFFEVLDAVRNSSNSAF